LTAASEHEGAAQAGEPAAYTNPAVRVEPRDASASLVAGWAIALIAMLVICYFVAQYVSRDYERRRRGMETTNGTFADNTAELPPAPRVQGGPGYESLLRRQAQEMARQAEIRLGSYGWVDRRQGIAHIPIEAAIDLWVAQQQQRGARAMPEKQAAAEHAPGPQDAPAGQPKAAEPQRAAQGLAPSAPAGGDKP